MSTGIEWTDKTWNPVTGCTKVSAGCKHCYAEVMAKRTFGTLYPPVYIGPTSEDEEYRPRQFTDVQTHADRLTTPLSWRKPRRVFVNSMSDLFHEAVPDAFIERVFSVMGLAERHTFQVLTKRPDRMLAWFQARRFDVKGAAILQTEIGECHYAMPWPLPNVWLGVSAEDQATADARIPLLLQTPAAVRFVSAEPLLGPIDLSAFCGTALCNEDECRQIRAMASWPFDGDGIRRCGCGSSAVIEKTGIDWVIVGGESGPKARPCDVAWVESIVRQCQTAGVPVFVKQLGAEPRWANVEAASTAPARGKCNDPAEWPEHLRVREFPEVRA